MRRVQRSVLGGVVAIGVALCGCAGTPAAPVTSPLGQGKVTIYSAGPGQRGETPAIVAVLKSVGSTGATPDVAARLALVERGAEFTPEVTHLVDSLPSFNTVNVVPETVIFGSPATCQVQAGGRACVTITYRIVVGSTPSDGTQQALLFQTADGWQMQAGSFCQFLQAVGGTCPPAVTSGP